MKGCQTLQRLTSKFSSLITLIMDGMVKSPHKERLSHSNHWIMMIKVEAFHHLLGSTVSAEQQSPKWSFGQCAIPLNTNGPDRRNATTTTLEHYIYMSSE